MRSFSGSKLSTLTLIRSPIFTRSEGCATRPHDMSVMWSRPSMPPRSTNAPKSVMFLTTPSRIWSFARSLRIVDLRRSRSSSSAARHHDVPAALVQLDDAHLHGLPEQRVDVLHLAERDLRSGQERLDPVE